jgi:hypothetical protein
LYKPFGLHRFALMISLSCCCMLSSECHLNGARRTTTWSLTVPLFSHHTH